MSVCFLFFELIFLVDESSRDLVVDVSLDLLLLCPQIFLREDLLVKTTDCKDTLFRLLKLLEISRFVVSLL